MGIDLLMVLVLYIVGLFGIIAISGSTLAMVEMPNRAAFVAPASGLDVKYWLHTDCSR
jgi:hypothetical protein